MLRRLRTPLLTVGGVGAAIGIDRAIAPKLAPLTTAAATAGSVGSVHIYQYEVKRPRASVLCCLCFVCNLARRVTPSRAPRQICPFCNKLKALLDLHRVPYETTDVNALTKRETKAWSGGYRKVPIAMLGGEQVNDSPVISTTLMDNIGAAGVVDAKQLAEFRSPKALEWAKWSDEKFAVLLFPNITRSFGESYQAFGYVMDVPHFSFVDKWSNQFIGSFFMWLAQGKIKKKYAIDDERMALQGGIDHWLSEGVGKGPFAGGQVPNFADVCVFGCLKAIDRTDAFREIMANTAIQPWYERMESAVQPGNSCTSRH